jgi:putative ABC transport system ATP-binding protein
MGTRDDMKTTETVIEVEKMTKVYRMGSIELHALRGVSLRVRCGEFVALMGPSGSGKSTLMHLLGCLDSPTSGRYFLEGHDVGRLSDDERAFIRNRRVGFVFQSFNLLPRLNVLENVMLPLMYCRRAEGSRRKALQALDAVGLTKHLTQTPATLSGGEQQRVAIARALVTDPALILADEPTGNLDSATGEEILRLLAGLHAADRTILMVTHNSSAASNAGRIVHLCDGCIVDREAADGIS